VVRRSSAWDRLPLGANDFVRRAPPSYRAQLNMAWWPDAPDRALSSVYLVCFAYLVGGAPGALHGLLALIPPVPVDPA